MWGKAKSAQMSSDPPTYNNTLPIFLAIDWRAIQYFVLGIITGIILLILSIAFILSRSERKKTKNLHDKLAHVM